MWRTTMLMAVAAALLALGAGVVLAQEEPAPEGDPVTVERRGEVIRCKTVPCRGTGGHDLIYERKGNGKRDKIIMKGGSDQVRAARYTNDRDVVKGGTGYDLIFVNDGDTRDRVSGGGRSRCYVDAPSEVVSGCSEVIVG
jgi:hypothetical protein